MSYDSLLDLVKKRRSIRRFKSDPVPRELIEKIVEAARWAPSGFNMQPLFRKRNSAGGLLKSPVISGARALKWRQRGPRTKAGRGNSPG